MVTLHKVTTFVTRGEGLERELLVCRHPHQGVIVPSGTVEAGEGVQVAALRQAAEETGLRELSIKAMLASLEQPLLPSQRVLVRAVDFRSAPDPVALPVGFTLRRGISVNLLETRSDFARVAYDEYEYNGQSGEYLITAQQEGWVPADALTRHVTRHLVHLEPTLPTDDRWTLQQGGDSIELYWVSLLQDPDLISAQDVWLGCVFDQLRA